MTKQEWLSKAETNRDALSTLIRGYHPFYFYHPPGPKRLNITAPNVEAVSHKIRATIRNNATGLPPVEQFLDALKESNLNKVNNILNEAWFGVPESTSCWSIEGFREAVELMEDLPEEE